MYRAELIGLAEIAAMAGVSSQAVANWRRRDATFPGAVAELRSGPVFDLYAVQKWIGKRRGTMANVISMINLKGGVGKTTSTVAIAEILAAEHRKKVLVVDLDPQTNATTMLISEDRWKDLNENHATLAQLFADALMEDVEDRKFSIDSALQKRVSPVQDVVRLDLLPSSLDLIDIQDRLAMIPPGRFYANQPTEILRRAVKDVLDDYDYVLIDCPPNLGLITLNGLRISDGFIIPTIPDYLSTYGIYQIIKRVGLFAHDIGEPIRPLGIAVCKYREQAVSHRDVLRGLRRKADGGELPKVFDSIIPESNSYSGAAEYGDVGTLRQRWGYQRGFQAYANLTREVMKSVGDA